MKGVSIIICCYNSALRLAETLEYITRQNVPPGILWELVIVNNNSSDHTIEIANDFFVLHPEINGSVVNENTPGLSYARQKGFDEARYDYVILCDDDNWLGADYIKLSFEIMESNGSIGCLGGCGKPVFEIDPPAWFNSYGDYYATGPQNDKSGDITNTRSFIYGAGAVFRRSALILLKQNGFKNLLTDRKGTSLVTGGDNELSYALILSGYKIWYDERLQFLHFIEARRLHLPYFLKLAKYNAYSKFLLVPYVDLIQLTIKEKYKYSFGWTLLSLFFLFVKYDLLNIPSLILNDSFYKFKISLAGRIGTLKAMMEYTGYQYRTLNMLKNASWYKKQ